MSNELKPGTWTRPSNEKEWRAILDLAKSLGVGGHEDDRTYPVYRLVAKLIGGTQDIRAIHYESPGSSMWKHDDEVSCGAFIAGMYAEAERRKEKLAEGDRIYAKGKPEIWQDHEKQLTSLAARIEKLEAWNLEQMFTEHADGFVAVDARLGPLVNVISKPLMKRIEALEPAFDEHLRKQHEQEVVLSDMDLLCIIRQRKDALIKTQDYADAKLWRDVERALIIAARIPVDAPESDT